MASWCPEGRAEGEDAVGVGVDMPAALALPLLLPPLASAGSSLALPVALVPPLAVHRSSLLGDWLSSLTSNSCSPPPPLLSRRQLKWTRQACDSPWKRTRTQSFSVEDGPRRDPRRVL
jgi:hypothetical protein